MQKVDDVAEDFSRGFERPTVLSHSLSRMLMVFPKKTLNIKVFY